MRMMTNILLGCFLHRMGRFLLVRFLELLLILSFLGMFLDRLLRVILLWHLDILSFGFRGIRDRLLGKLKVHFLRHLLLRRFHLG